MLFEYRYNIGSDGVHFSLLEGVDDALTAEGSPEEVLSIRRFIMQAWEDAINQTSGPDEIGKLMTTPEGQKILAARAEGYLARALENFPPELDRRGGRERRVEGRPKTERRRIRHG
jgi:hypothetical protein